MPASAGAGFAARGAAHHPPSDDVGVRPVGGGPRRTGGQRADGIRWRGAILILALVGARLQDGKKRGQMGAAWASHEAATSFVPFGRSGFAMPAFTALLGGIVLFVVATGVHPLAGGPNLWGMASVPPEPPCVSPARRRASGRRSPAPSPPTARGVILSGAHAACARRRRFRLSGIAHSRLRHDRPRGAAGDRRRSGAGRPARQQRRDLAAQPVPRHWLRRLSHGHGGRFLRTPAADAARRAGDGRGARR